MSLMQKCSSYLKEIKASLFGTKYDDPHPRNIDFDFLKWHITLWKWLHNICISYRTRTFIIKVFTKYIGGNHRQVGYSKGGLLRYWFLMTLLTFGLVKLMVC